MAVDLHAHTTASDGSMTPTELVAYAKSKGLNALAVTDHDTVDGIDEALQQGKKLGITVVPGAEFSSSLYGCDIHIVGLFINHHSERLNEFLKELSITRNKRNQQILSKMLDQNIVLPGFEPGCATGRSISRAHLAKALMQNGYAASMKEAFDKYLSRGGLVYVKRESCDAKDCISVIHEAGGISILAHLNQIKGDLELVRRICQRLKEYGLDGIEIRHSEYNSHWEQTTQELAKRFSFQVSGGSDYHGTYKPGLDLGCGYGELLVPDSIYENLITYQKG